MVIRGALVALAILILLYAGLLLWFRLSEDSLIFDPTVGKNEPPDPKLGLPAHDVTLRSHDELRLQARVIPPPPSIKSDQQTWLVYLHGSSGSIGLPAYNEAWAVFHRHGLGIFAVDYRGFGESEGEISEAGIYRDAESAYRYLREEMGVPQERIVLYGFSLGSAVAIDLATRVDAAALIVEGSLLSVPDLGAERYPFLPAHLIAKNRFASIEKIGHVRMPQLFLHARNDQAIPITHSRVLYEKAPGPKRFLELGGTHGTSHEVDTKFFRFVTEFIRAQGLVALDP